MMRIFLYTIWFLFAALFFVMALWAKLEQISNKGKKQNAGDFARQGLFVLAAVLVSLLIDQYILESVVTSLSPEFIPLGFYQIILLPVVLLTGAKILGPSKTIRITKAPRPTERRKR